MVTRFYTFSPEGLAELIGQRRRWQVIVKLGKLKKRGVVSKESSARRAGERHEGDFPPASRLLYP